MDPYLCYLDVERERVTLVGEWSGELLLIRKGCLVAVVVFRKSNISSLFYYYLLCSVTVIFILFQFCNTLFKKITRNALRSALIHKIRQIWDGRNIALQANHSHHKSKENRHTQKMHSSPYSVVAKFVIRFIVM